MTHLDTSFLVRALAAGTAESARLDGWLSEERPLAVAAPAWAEFLCGPVSAAVVRVASDVVGVPKPFGVRDAVTAADCFNASGRRRRTMLDCMIAAAAMNAGAELATANAADFERLVPLGLRLVR